MSIYVKVRRDYFNERLEFYFYYTYTNAKCFHRFRTECKYTKNENINYERIAKKPNYSERNNASVTFRIVISILRCRIDHKRLSASCCVGEHNIVRLLYWSDAGYAKIAFCYSTSVTLVNIQ